MNRKRKKTKLPLEYQVESFFKKVLYLNNEIEKKQNKKNSLNLDNLKFEDLVYNGMRQYEKLINTFKYYSISNYSLSDSIKYKNENKIKNNKFKNVDYEYYKYDDENSSDKKDK